MPYTQLGHQERYVISHLHMAGFKPAEIALKLGRHRSTIGRELKRNRCPYDFGRDRLSYFYDTAQSLAQQRCAQANRRYKLDDSPVGRYVRAGLEQHWSPQQIAERLKRDHPRDPAMRITHETIYQPEFRLNVTRFLPSGGCLLREDATQPCGGPKEGKE